MRTALVLLLVALASSQVATSSVISQGRSPALTAALASFDDVWQTINDSYYDPKFGGLD